MLYARHTVMGTENLKIPKGFSDHVYLNSLLQKRKAGILCTNNRE